MRPPSNSRARHARLTGRPSQPARVDVEYERGGVKNIFLLCEPLTGRRHDTVTDRQTRRNFAQQISYLVDELYPTAERIILVMDNLNTDAPGSLYETFPPAEAKRLTEKLDIHPTLKHDGWITMAEIELSVLSRQCLDRRIPDGVTLESEVDSCEEQRNNTRSVIDWRFTAGDTRIKLKRLHPSVHV